MIWCWVCPGFRDFNPIIDFRLRTLTYPGESICTESDGTLPISTMSCAQCTLLPAEYRDFHDVFDKNKAEELPEHGTHDCVLQLKDPKAILPAPKMYKLTVQERLELRHYLDDNLAKGFIRPSTSPAGSPIFFVMKKDGTLRPVVDYREMNELLVRNKAPLPIISDLFSVVSKAKYFTKIHLRNAYWLIRIRQGHEYLTAFKTPWGLFEYIVMPFGLANAPAVFQGMMNAIFFDILDQFVIVFQDDLLIFPEDEESHRQHVRTVLDRLRKHRLFAKLEKCDFTCKQVEFLGFSISQEGLRMTPEKIQSSVLEWPTPSDRRNLQRFLGLANFLREFVKYYSAIAKPLTDLTSPKREFIWSTKEIQSFQALKATLTNSPVLKHPDPNKLFLVEPDASNYAVGAILLQQHEGRLHPVAYHSRKLLPAERNYTVHDKELLSIIDAFRVWRHHLLGAGHTVTVLSDHQNLVYFSKRRQLSQRHARWSLFLSQYDFTITYQPGVCNNRSDAIS